MAKKHDYITLKEAAALSGYSSDYIGQLIRGGKLHGKQVFLNVAWVTTEEALQEYVQKEKRKQQLQSVSTPNLKEKIFSPEMLEMLFIYAAWIVVGIVGLFCLFLVYVFAVNMDHRIDTHYLQNSGHIQNVAH